MEDIVCSQVDIRRNKGLNARMRRPLAAFVLLALSLTPAAAMVGGAQPAAEARGDPW